MSDKQSQKEAVYNAVMSVVAQTSGNLSDGTNVLPILSKEIRSKINSIIFEGFKSNSIVLDRNFNSDAELRTYCSSLVSNWLRKDKRLNGNSKYVAKNPGSRIGSTDPQIKALRALMKSQTDPTKIVEIESFISKRLNEINQSAN